MKMKRFLFVPVLALCLSFCSFNNLGHDGPEALILNYIPPITTNTPHPRSPAAPVYAEQYGHVIFLPTSLGGCLVELLDEVGSVIWYGFLCNDGSCEFPEGITGAYMLKLYVNESTFVGNIELE